VERWTVKSFSEIAQVLLGVKAVNDLGGIRKLIVGDIPDPGGAIPSTILRDAWQKRRRVASRQTRWAKETVRRRYPMQKHSLARRNK